MLNPTTSTKKMEQACVVDTAGGGDAPATIVEIMGANLNPVSPLQFRNDEHRDDVRETFVNMMTENILLKKKNRDNINEILRLQAVMMELRAKREREERAETVSSHLNRSNRQLERTQDILDGLGLGLSPNTSISVVELNDDFSDVRNVSLSESMIGWVGENKDQVIDKVGSTTVRLRDFGIGGVTGYSFCWALKSFGKFAAAATAGGVLMLYVCGQQRYIVVDWNRVNEQLAGLEASTLVCDDPEIAVEATTGSKFKNLSDYITKLTAMGFFAGFVYKAWSS